MAMTAITELQILHGIEPELYNTYQDLVNVLEARGYVKEAGPVWVRREAKTFMGAPYTAVWKVTDAMIKEAVAVRVARVDVTSTQIRAIASTLDANVAEARRVSAVDLGIEGKQLQLEHISAKSTSQISETLDINYVEAKKLLLDILKAEGATDVIADKDKEKSWWAKYWWVIIIIVILVVAAGVYLGIRYF